MTYAGGMPLPNMTPRQLLDAATQLVQECPDAELIKNQIGNLAIERDGEYLGWVDMRTGEVTLFQPGDPDWRPGATE